MSKILGPIHVWLFNKIQFQDQLTYQILENAKRKGYHECLTEEIDQLYGCLPKGELEDIIEATNIHGWLQTQVSLVENRLAYVVTSLLKEDSERINCIMSVAYDFGKAHGIEHGISVKKAYECLENLLLNGMPCDRVNQIVEETNEKIVWKQTIDIHEPYWTKINGNIKYYYDIREALIKGMLAGTKITFTAMHDQKYVLC